MESNNCLIHDMPDREEMEKYAADYVCKLTPSEREDFFRKLAEIVSE